MEALLQESTYTQEKTLADRVNEILKETNMSIEELSLRVAYARPTLSQYLNNKYRSDPSKVEAKLTMFVQEYELEAGEGEGTGTGQQPVLKSYSVIRPKVEYFESIDFVNTIGLCKSCQENAALGIVVAKSGYGKTHTLKKYAKMPRAIYIVGSETMNNKDIIRKIESRIGMSRSYGSIEERKERIIEFFNVNEGYLIIMDEADKLINKYTQKKINVLRDITDESAVGLVIAGEPILESLIKTYNERLAKRIEFYYELKGLSQQEVRAYLQGYDVDEAAMSEFMVRATNSRTGCFRLLDRTLNNIIRILKDSGQTKVTMKVMKQASNMMML